jgi:hypothetical protein
MLMMFSSDRCALLYNVRVSKSLPSIAAYYMSALKCMQRATYDTLAAMSVDDDANGDP